MDISGRIKVIFDTVEIGSNGFTKKEFVIETDEKYPQLIKFELTKDKTNLVDGMTENDSVDVFFNIRGREWNGKYFTNLECWKIQKKSQTQKNESVTEDKTDNGDLPF